MNEAGVTSGSGTSMHHRTFIPMEAENAESAAGARGGPSSLWRLRMRRVLQERAEDRRGAGICEWPF